MFGGEELRQFVEQAAWVTVNDYEWQVLKERTGWDVGEFKQRVKGLIVTRAAEGSVIYTPEMDLDIPAAEPVVVSDPTGCGDAYRAGLLFGFMADYDWPTVGRVASLMGAIKIECHGTLRGAGHDQAFHTLLEITDIPSRSLLQYLPLIIIHCDPSRLFHELTQFLAAEHR